MPCSPAFVGGAPRTNVRWICLPRHWGLRYDFQILLGAGVRPGRLHSFLDVNFIQVYNPATNHVKFNVQIWSNADMT